jgi:MFS transporter, FHS family, L-fucose permease
VELLHHLRPDYTGLPEKTVGYFLTGTLVAFTIGRFLATYLMRFIEPRKLMGYYSVANMGLVAVGVLLPGWIGLWGIFLTSFFMSLMFPTIFALGIKGLGPNTKIGGSIIVMTMIGGAIFTPVMGLIFEVTRSMANAMLVPLVCYAFIAYYAFIGSRIPVPEPALVSR